MKEIVIDKEENKIICALLENEELVELYEEDENNKLNEGNIYCGIVRNILPSMQCAFVDINEKKNAFLHIRDILPKVSQETGNRDENFDKYDINDYIKVKMPIMVQVKKEEENQKGSRASTNINITGRYIVLIPGVKFVTISQKISDEKVKENLKKSVSEIMSNINNDKEEYGIIIRTSAQFVDIEKIKEDIDLLIKDWKKILNKYEDAQKSEKPVKIYDNQDLIKKIIVGNINNEKCKIIVNTKELFDNVNDIIKDLPNKNLEIEIKEKDILNTYDIEEKMNKVNERKIWIKCGGFITIDKTEALTAIDVNSGKFIGKKNDNKRETVYLVNRDATIEIAKQIRLRNISGIIIIDYINMEDDEDRDSIINLLEKELKKDRSKTQIAGFTKLDLLEITRKRL